MTFNSNCNGSSAIITIDETYSLCSVPNVPAFANLSNCCGSAPVQYTPDYCRKFCAYNFSKASEWFQCVRDDPRAACQNASGATTTTGSFQTNPTTTSRASLSFAWSKSAFFLAVLCIVGLAHGQQIQSCKDGQCQDCDVGDGPDPPGPSEWNIQEGYPDCIIYNGASFQGAELVAGEGYEVWWNIGQPNPTCQIVVMSPVSADISISNCGNVVVAAKNAGCYPSIIQSTFMVQYCCGSGDCSAAGIATTKRTLDGTVAWPIYLGNHTLLNTFNLSSKSVSEPTTFITSISKTPTKPSKHHGNHTPLGTFNLSSKPVPKLITSATSISTTPTKPSPAHTNTFIGTGRWVSKRGTGGGDGERETGGGEGTKTTSPSPSISCNAPTNVGDSYTKSTGQQQISNVLECDSNTNCQQAYWQSITVTSTLTIINGTTITLSGGTSVSFTEDLEIFSSTQQFNFEVAHAMETATWAANSTANGVITTQTLQQIPGTSAYVYFNPILNCQKKSGTCNGASFEVEVCNPSVGPDGIPVGDIGLTYIT